MRPTFLGFETTRKSLMASQKALDITGHNISNVNTTGYSRQRVDLFSMVTTSGGTRYAASKVMCAGQGVYMSGVDQIRDPFLDKKFRELNSDTAEAGIKSSILTDVDNVLDNIDTEGLQKSLLKFQRTMESFATDSTDRVEIANILTQSAKQLVNVINNYDFKLTQIQDQIKFEVDASISDVNATLNKIADLNKQIADTYVSNGEVSYGLAGDYTVNATYGPNELLDTRNVLLDSLSSYGDIEVQDAKDGTVTVKFAGATVIEGNKATQLSCSEDSITGALMLGFNNGSSFSPKSGSLKGYVDVYNGNGCYTQGAQNGSEGLAYFKTVIDKFSETMANEFNKMNEDPANPGVERPLFTTSDGSVVFTAKNLRVSDDWVNKPMSILPTNQDGELDNAHIYRLLSVFDKQVEFGDKNDFEGTFEGYISYFTNKLSQEITFQSGKFESNDSLTTSILSERDAKSAVSLDEEGINMMNYQKWFNASARVMTTLDEALDKIINSMGLVGR